MITFGMRRTWIEEGRDRYAKAIQFCGYRTKTEAREYVREYVADKIAAHEKEEAEDAWAYERIWG